MKKATKLWLIIASFLAIAGLLLFTAVMWQYQWDFTKLNTRRYETNTHKVDGNFSNLSVDTDTANIVFLLAEDGKCKVECYEESTVKHSVTIEQDTLCIKVTDAKRWYDYIGIGFQSPKVTVYLPETAYTCLLVDESTGSVTVPRELTFEKMDISTHTGDVSCLATVSGPAKIKTGTGDVLVQNTSLGALDLWTSTGEITVCDVTCKETAALRVSTGDILLKNTVVTKMLSIQADTGDIRFDGADAAAIKVETDTGNVTGSLLTEKVFLTHTDTGKVKVPPTVTGGTCDIRTDTGNIILAIQ